ncbi:unnamed protein product [Mycena citricolor]|uniref:Uncharacterized protein n=1 Tax=Mycena citricolor TaxID=2018698 RepID=A0AAD2Q5H4_9AGAR|nr:unnamed protein product [Mycena citricolor]
MIYAQQELLMRVMSLGRLTPISSISGNWFSGERGKHDLTGWRKTRAEPGTVTRARDRHRLPSPARVPGQGRPVYSWNLCWIRLVKAGK